MGANSFGEKILSLKERKTAILNSQNIRMLQTHVHNNIYNKYCLIHNTLHFMNVRNVDCIDVSNVSIND